MYCVNRVDFNVSVNSFPGRAPFLQPFSGVPLSHVGAGVWFFLPALCGRAKLWQLHFALLRHECLPKLEGVFWVLRLTFDFQWQPGWISAISQVARRLTLTNRTGYSAGVLGNSRWWDLFMPSLHALKTVGLNSCLGWVEQCYNRGVLTPSLRKHKATLSLTPPQFSPINSKQSGLLQGWQ